MSAKYILFWARTFISHPDILHLHDRFPKHGDKKKGFIWKQNKKKKHVEHQTQVMRFDHIDDNGQHGGHKVAYDN